MQNSLVIPKALGKIGAYLSHLSLPNLLAGLVIFFSSTQLGLHFWPLSSLVYGIRIDYLSPTIYFLDILIVLFLGSDLLRKSWLSAKMFSRTTKTSSETRSDPQGILIALFPPLLVNLLYSQNPLSTLSWSLHFLLYALFAATLGSDLKGSAQPADSKAGRSDPKAVIIVALTFSLLFQLALSATQVVLGHSLGGLLYYLGERTVAVGRPAIALGWFMDSVVLRAYGTFSHPNILAGYAVISLLILLRLRPQGLTLKDEPNPAYSKAGKVRPYWKLSRPGQTLWLPTVLTTLLVLLTQSRSAALSLFGLVIPFYLLQNLKSRIIYFVIILTSVFSILNSGALSRATDLSLSERLSLQGLSSQVIRQFPIFGTGTNASISTYSSVSPTERLLQPDHNSFTLFLSWFGLFGVLAILYSLRPYYRLSSIVYHLVPLSPLLLFDHYLLTSPQGLFIFLFYLGAATISAPDQIKKH